MKRRTTKILALLFTVVLIFGAMPFSAFADFKIDPKIQVQHKNGGSDSYQTLLNAVNSAKDGDVISIAGEVTSYSTTENINITKNITIKTGENFSGSAKYLQYNGTSAPLFTVKNGATLTIKDSLIYGNTNAESIYGGLIRVENGGKLIIDGKTSISGCKLTATDSKGGVVYVAKGGKVTVNAGTFKNNSAATGNDICAENKDDVTVKSGVTVSVDYYEGSIPNLCPYCGKVHSDDFFGQIVKIFHMVLNFFNNLF